MTPSDSTSPEEPHRGPAPSEAFPDSTESEAELFSEVYGPQTLDDFRKIVAELDGAWPSLGNEKAHRIAQVGPFENLVQVGSGGMGIVFRGFDPRTGEHVAVKVAAPGVMIDAPLRERFRREASAAKSLDHPNIVRFRESGEDGRYLYIASDFCDGPNLEKWLRWRSDLVAPRAAAEFVAILADAVAHSHGREVIHRDIKPSNILLPDGWHVEELESLSPLLADFGLAKLGESDEHGDPDASHMLLSVTGEVLGTPPYMAPEQAQGNRSAIGPRTDIHGLGALLYKLLTGRPPFQGATRAKIIRAVIRDDPIPPSVQRAGLPPELDVIVLKCLEKNPRHRYGSAVELSDDLRRCFSGRKIRARPAPFRRRAARWIRRRPKLAFGLAIASLTCALVLCAGVGWSLWLTHLNGIVTRERDLANRLNYGLRLQSVQRPLREGELGRAQRLLRDLRPAEGQPDLREFAWRLLWSTSREEARLLGEMDSFVTPSDSPLSRDGRWLGLIDYEGNLGLFDAERGELVRYRRRLEKGRGDKVAISPDGRFLIATFAEADSNGSTSAVKAQVWDVLDGSMRDLLPKIDPGPVDHLMLADQGRIIALKSRRYVRPGSDEDDLSIWRIGLDGGVAPMLVGSRHSKGVAFHYFGISPDGSMYVDRDPVHGLAIYDTKALSIRKVLDQSPRNPERYHARFSADGRRLAVADLDAHHVYAWDVATGVLDFRMVMPGVAVTQMALQPNGKAILISDQNRRLRLIDPSRNADVEVHPPPAHPGPVFDLRLAFTADGKEFLADREVYMEPSKIELRSAAHGALLAESPVREAGAVRLWSVLDPTVGRPGLIYSVGRHVWHWDWEATLRRRAPVPKIKHDDEGWAVAYSRDGARLATGSNDTNESQTIKIWDARSKAFLKGWRAHEATVTSVSFSPDGRRLLSSGLAVSGGVRIWDPTSGVLLGEPEWPAEAARNAAFNETGTLLAAVGNQGTLRVWNARDLTVRWTRTAHADRIHALAFSPDASRIATGACDGLLRFWDAESGRQAGEVRLTSQPFAIAYAPDGASLAVACGEGDIHIIDPTTGAILRTLRCDDQELRALAYSVDGRTLAVGGIGKAVQLWDPTTGYELLTLEGQPGQVNAVAFSPDDRELASIDHSGEVRTWRAAPLDP
ncbi:serine/threonine-protein kinase [Paludisphaera mucosa]|uniref:Protein kinase n=1 Tax=Paludisphaera mucosa TaxID=3030827 RepID=A0ABT6F3X5_9BACT|nr:protein kinase [Paludisphaera mucosa]MDG3002251.1 protein kinase [Paludisphaera mucosa]